MKHIICIVGPSGVGKTTLIRNLIKKHGFIAPMIVTTRAKRNDDSGNYLYVSTFSFREMIENDLLLEWDEYTGMYYGILMYSFETSLNFSREGVIIEATPSACRQIKDKRPEAKIIALLPDDTLWLKNRLIKRNCQSEEEIERRMAGVDLFIEQTAALGGYTITAKEFSEKEDILSRAEEIIFKKG